MIQALAQHRLLRKGALPVLFGCLMLGLSHPAHHASAAASAAAGTPAHRGADKPHLLRAFSAGGEATMRDFGPLPAYVPDGGDIRSWST
ncbi:MAG TPA: hypothetical protein VFA75_20915 [Nevskia sp.]|nr:hypothetical protein [Nevskia sp.]